MSMVRPSEVPADSLLSRYVAVLALLPAVCGFIGASVIGVVVPGTGLVRASLFDGVANPTPELEPSPWPLVLLVSI